MSLKDDNEGRKALGSMLVMCFDTMKIYGKEPEQLKNAAALFQLVLADFPIDKIQQAFVYHLQNSVEMPTPADIATIIRRGNKPPFERSVYVSISKKDAELRTSEEWQYMRDYERHQIEG